MSFLYHALLYRPLLNLLVVFYNSIAFGDLGVAIIFLTLTVRLVLYPLFHKGTRDQMALQRLQPKLKKIQEDHRGNREKQTEATLALYREHKVSPFSPTLLLLVQLPILIALYQIFLHVTSPELLTPLYAFVRAPAVLNTVSFGLINLGRESTLFVGLAALLQFVQGWFAVPRRKAGEKASQAEIMGRIMAVVGALVTFGIFHLYHLPAAVALYWIVTSLFSTAQQTIINRQFSRHGVGEVRDEDNRAHGV